MLFAMTEPAGGREKIRSKREPNAMWSSSGRVQRPFGVTLIAFVTLIAVVLPLWSLSKARLPASMPAEEVGRLRAWARLAGMWAALGLLTAAGLFGMRGWGWWLGLVYYLGSIPLLLLRPGPLETSTLVFQGGLAMLIVLYLLSREVREAFFRR